jgi:uncharacterized MAPEG superfamily protein
MLKYGVIAIFIPLLCVHVAAETSNEGKTPSSLPPKRIFRNSEGCEKHEKDKQTQFVQGEVLVKFKADVTGEEIDGIRKAYGLFLVERIEGIGVYRFKIPPRQRVNDMVDALNEDPHVEYVEPNYVLRIPR